MPTLFKNETEIKNYLVQAASDSANLRVMADGKRINYRNLDIKIGVTCYVIVQGQILILILERSPLVNFGGRWGTVSGYIDDLEIIQNSKQICRDHLIQEFQEEIGWTISDGMILTYCGTHALIEPQLKIHFEIFSLLINEPPAITLNQEHKRDRWVDLNTIKELRPILITQFLEGLEKVLG